ncbi:MAG TPA: hypothetical protein EYQ54_12625 [Myxococcales bacterium]|nr:hypothetical protein [Myxococcales bacterium]
MPELFSDSGCFGTAAARRYPWSYHYDTSEYMGLMETHSDHRLLPAEQRERLHDAMARALERFGGGIKVSYEANLYLAKLAP